MNPYEILGVAGDASEDDIKKAYKKLAMEWHPDRHGGSKEAEEKFKEINAAYQVLTGKNKDLRQPQGFNPFDIFNETMGFDIFGGGFPFGGFPHRQQQGQPHLTMQVMLEDVCTGGRKSVRYTIRSKCTGCGGIGRELGNEVCQGCGGSGKQTMSRTGGFLISMPCQSCGGLGRKPGKVCETCRGAKTVGTDHETAVEVPAGIANGETLQAENGSHITVIYAEHPLFGIVPGTLDAVGEIDADLFDFVLGNFVMVPTLAGEKRVRINPGLRPGSRLRVKGAGLPDKKGNRGDHIVRVWAKVPNLTEDQKQALEKIREAR